MLAHTINLSSPYFFILNAGSGNESAAHRSAIIRDVFAHAGQPCHITVIENPKNLSAIAKQIVDRALTLKGVVVACGGDGAINAVAQHAVRTGCPFGVIPQGTFNYFARTHAIPEDTAEAARLLLAGVPQPTQVGMVNHHVFLVNASLGLYPELLEQRETFKQKLGRSRLIALLSGFVTLFREHRTLKILLSGGSQPSTVVNTSTLFVGNNPLQLEQLGLPQATAPREGALAGIMLKPTSRFNMLKLMWHGAVGELGEDENIESFRFQKLHVRRLSLPGRKVKVAADGEIIHLKTPLQFSVSAHPLYLIRPERKDD